MKILKRNWRALVADLFCWSGLVALLLNQEFKWALVFVASGLVLNYVFRKYPAINFSRILRN